MKEGENIVCMRPLQLVLLTPVLFSLIVIWLNCVHFQPLICPDNLAFSLIHS